MQTSRCSCSHLLLHLFRLAELFLLFCHEAAFLAAPVARLRLADRFSFLAAHGGFSHGRRIRPTRVTVSNDSPRGNRPNTFHGRLFGEHVRPGRAESTRTNSLARRRSGRPPGITARRLFENGRSARSSASRWPARRCDTWQ